MDFFFILNAIYKCRTNKKSDLELIYDDFSRKHSSSHTLLFTQLAAVSTVTPQRRKREGEKDTRKHEAQNTGWPQKFIFPAMK